MPIASLESLIGRKSYLPYLQAGAVDVAIIDTLWNGVGESIKIAGLCDTFEVNCAAHNYHGWLGTAISAHFCASIPNFKVLEVDVDDVPWKDEIVTVVPRIENSTFYMPTGPVRYRNLPSVPCNHVQNHDTTAFDYFCAPLYVRCVCAWSSRAGELMSMKMP